MTETTRATECRVFGVTLMLAFELGSTKWTGAPLTRPMDAIQNAPTRFAQRPQALGAFSFGTTTAQEGDISISR